VSEPRSVVRVALTRFLLLSFGTLVVVGAGTSVVSESIAAQGAEHDARTRASGMAGDIAVHRVTTALRNREPEAVRDLGKALSRAIGDDLTQEPMEHIVVWDSGGTVLWSETGEIGDTFEFPEGVGRLAEQGSGAKVFKPGERDESPPHPGPGTADEKLAEVYIGARGADGKPFVFEAHTPIESIDDRSAAIFMRLLPLSLGGLLLLQLANVPLALSLARRVDRSTDHRSMILSRSLMSWHDERRRLAQDLHDGVIQDLSAMSYALPAVLAQLPDDPEADPARSIGERMTEALTQDLRALRSVLIDLVPADLDGNGLEVALETLAQRSADRGLQVDVTVQPDLGVGSTVAGLVYRVAREGLRNAEKHAEARTATLHVARLGDQVEVVVRDDGRGVRTTEAADGHVGLRLLEEVVADAGGSLALSNGTDQGAQLRGVIPAVLPELDDVSRRH
jgi:signal transduction histidine kinase